MANGNKVGQLSCVWELRFMRFTIKQLSDKILKPHLNGLSLHVANSNRAGQRMSRHVQEFVTTVTVKFSYIITVFFEIVSSKTLIFLCNIFTISQWFNILYFDFATTLQFARCRSFKNFIDQFRGKKSILQSSVLKASTFQWANQITIPRQNSLAFSTLWSFRRWNILIKIYIFSRIKNERPSKP